MKRPGSAALAEGFAWIESFTNFERQHADSLRPFRLDRMREMALRFDNPQESYRSVHVAGSKGKGSTCAFLGSILTHAGFRTGVYGSPHVDSYLERFMLDGEFLDRRILEETIDSVRRGLAEFRFTDGSNPTTFELLTLVGMIGFQRAACDYVVFETGLGGRLDATNILEPRLSLITSIELEHTRILGDTLGEVAGEKGGIIKPGVPVLLGEIPPEALERLTSIAVERTSPCYRLHSVSRLVQTEVDRIELHVAGRKPLEARLGMIGFHQGVNAALAAAAALLLLEGEGSATNEQIAAGIRTAGLPGRFEICPVAGREWIYDAAHTPNSIRRGAETFRYRYSRGGVLLIGIGADKDLPGIAAALPEDLSAVIVSRPGVFKVSHPEVVAEALRSRYPDLELIPETDAACRRAAKIALSGEPILVTGSFYLLGAVREQMRRLAMYSKRLERLTPYTPGEQPRDRKFIKLNTNENPFSPAPGITDALQRFSADSLRLYPDPDSALLREAFAKRFGCSKSEIFCGNGSDEVLALAFYAFFDPDSGPLLMPDVSYSFYPVFCAFHGLTAHEIPLEADFTIDLSSYSRYAHDHSYAGIILANPNAPTGIALERTELKSLLSSLPDDRVLIVDEAYVDFGAESMVEAIERFENLLVIGTLSKSYSLAGLRLGYAVGQPHLIDALNRAKDSFNSYPVSRIAQELGRIALENTDHFCRCRDELIAIREASAGKLRRRGWKVLPSATNFLFAAPPRIAAAKIYEELKKGGVLVRYFPKPRVDAYVRISIGTRAEMDSFFHLLDIVDPAGSVDEDPTRLVD